MTDIKKWIPNIITLSNLGCGMIACWIAARNIPDFLQNESQIENKWLMVSPSLFIFAAAIFDFLDGLAARLLNVSSDLGKQLDSLADIVSFGIAPSFIIIAYSYLGDYSAFGLFLGIFAAIRLAKFNNDTRQSDSFLGLPVPSAGLIIASLPFIDNTDVLAFLHNFWVMAILIIALCLLMISEIPLLALKFKNLNLKDNIFRYILLLIATVLLIFFGFQSISLIIFSYILISIIFLKFELK